MRYIEAPNSIELQGPAVFLAGGITGCEDWQARAVAHLKDYDCTVLNPRRADFDVTDPTAASTQIRWEWCALEVAHVGAFWFPACDPAVTTQPIALFELGRWSGRHGPLVVGVDPHYPRSFDVITQMDLERNEPVFIDFEHWIKAVVYELDHVTERLRFG